MNKILFLDNQLCQMLRPVLVYRKNIEGESNNIYFIF